MKVFRGRAFGAVIASVVLCLSACSSGSSSHAANTGTAGPSGTSTASKDPIKIGIMLPINSPVLSLKSVLAAAKVAVLAVNDRGGVKGRPIKLISCDDMNDPTVAATCATQLLEQDKVVALAGTISLVGGPLYPVLQHVGTVNFGDYPILPVDLQNPLSYPLNGGAAGWSDVVYAAVKPQDIHRVALISTAGPTADFIFPGVKSVLSPQGIQTDLIGTPQAITDYATIAAKVASLKADAVVLALPVAQNFPMFQALKVQGLGSLPVYMSGANLTDDVINGATAQGINARYGLQFAVDPSKSPVRKQYNDEVAKYGAQVGGVQDHQSDLDVNAWLAVTDLAQVLAKLPTIDGASLKRYLDEQTAFDTGLTHPLDFAKPGAVYPRIFNNWASSGELVNGQVSQAKIVWASPPK